jgi:hypothetical protein
MKNRIKSVMPNGIMGLERVNDIATLKILEILDLDSVRHLITANKVCFFYQCPEHCSCHRTYQQMQALFAIKLQCL